MSLKIASSTYYSFSEYKGNVKSIDSIDGDGIVIPEGFVSIGSIFPDTWSWPLFWNLTALLSVALAFMNFLPIPVLDGGYFLMLIYEMITGRKPNDKFMEVAANIGMFILLALLIFANGNDIIKLIMGKF